MITERLKRHGAKGAEIKLRAGDSETPVAGRGCAAATAHNGCRKDQKECRPWPSDVSMRCLPPTLPLLPPTEPQHPAPPLPPHPSPLPVPSPFRGGLHNGSYEKCETQSSASKKGWDSLQGSGGRFAAPPGIPAPPQSSTCCIFCQSTLRAWCPDPSASLRRTAPHPEPPL